MNKKFFSIRRVAALLFGTALLATGFSACKRNQPDPIDPTVTQFTNSKTVSASISGQALDENGNPLANAMVTVGTSTYQTSNDGGFFFKNITLKENAQLVKITKPGYFTGYRTLKIKAGKDHFTRIAVLKKDNAQTFDATQSKTVQAANGASINFGANTIVNAQTNQAYTGSVTVFAKTIRANDPNIAQLTPGALRGITTEGGETGLSTFGMIGVEMEDASGNALQIATGKTAEIVIPIAANQVATAPTTIPLWHFDEAKAMWVQEGTASKVGNEYKGTVSHFSYWNYDLSIPLVTMDATFLNSANSTGLGGYVVEVISSANGTRYGYTNGLGEAYGMVPANSTLTINLVDPMCNIVLYSTTTTTATSNISLGNTNVTLPTVNALTVTGNVVNCANAALPNAPVSIQVGNFLMMTNSDASGNFSWSGVMCTPSATSTVAAYDVAAGVSGSINPTLIVGSNAVGAISACGTVIELFTYTLNNGSGPTTFTYMAPLSQFYTSAQAANTYVTLQDSASGPAANSLNMDFDGTQTIGTHNINSFNHYSQGGGLMTNIKTGANPVLPVTIVQFGSTTGSYIKGNFSGSFVDAVSSSTYTVTGNFNLERDF